MGVVRVVTDSTSGLPPRLLREWGIGVIPLQVTLGERAGLEGPGFGPAEVAAALAAHERVLTSQPAPAAFATAWGAGGEVLAVHLASSLSGTVSAASMAAGFFAGTVEVVDAGSTSMGLGFVVLAAARVAATGGSLAEVAAAAREAVQQTDSILCLESTETLRRGGRLGAATVRVGAALSVRSILHLVDGAITPLERVRTSARALQRLEELAVERCEGGRAEIAVLHLGAPLLAEALARRLDERLGASLAELDVTEVGAVVAAHVGLGCVGVVVHRL